VDRIRFAVLGVLFRLFTLDLLINEDDRFVVFVMDERVEGGEENDDEEEEEEEEEEEVC